MMIEEIDTDGSGTVDFDGKSRIRYEGTRNRRTIYTLFTAALKP